VNGACSNVSPQVFFFQPSIWPEFSDSLFDDPIQESRCGFPEYTMQRLLNQLDPAKRFYRAAVEKRTA
jgi:hypothetical protein